MGGIGENDMVLAEIGLRFNAFVLEKEKAQWTVMRGKHVPQEVRAAVAEQLGTEEAYLREPRVRDFARLHLSKRAMHGWAWQAQSEQWHSGDPLPSDAENIAYWMEKVNHPDGPQLPLVFIQADQLPKVLHRTEDLFQPFLMVSSERIKHRIKQGWHPIPILEPTIYTDVGLVPLSGREEQWEIVPVSTHYQQDIEGLGYLTFPIWAPIQVADQITPYIGQVTLTKEKIYWVTSAEILTKELPTFIDVRSFHQALDYANR